MQIGFASTDITPSIGMEQPGSLGKQFHTRIHDPLCVKAVVIEDEEQSVALVGIDALSVKRSVVQAARAVVEEKTGIPAGNIMVGASHTHSGGPTVGARPGDFAHAFDRDFCEPRITRQRPIWPIWNTSPARLPLPSLWQMSTSRRRCSR